MPPKLIVGVNKKIGLPDFGSCGTSCHVEVEIDSGLIFDDLDAFHHKVRQAYVALRWSTAHEVRIESWSKFISEAYWNVELKERMICRPRG